MPLSWMVVSILVLATIYGVVLCKTKPPPRRPFIIRQRMQGRQRVLGRDELLRHLTHLRDDDARIMLQLAELERQMRGEKVNWKQEGF